MRAKKLIKLLLWLALLALCLLLLAMQQEFPRYTRQSAMHRAESRQLLEPSRALTWVDMNPNRNKEVPWRRQLQVGCIGDQLHMGLLKRSDLAWECDWVMVYPLEEVSVGMLPWEPYSSPERMDTCGFVLCARPWTGGEATLTIGDRTFSGVFQPDSAGFALIPFPDVPDKMADLYRQQVTRLQLEEMEYNNFYILDDRTMDITLDVVLFDQAGGEMGRYQKHYPAP